MSLSILFVSPGYHPLTGGAETHVRLLAEGLRQSGHKVAVLTDNRDFLEHEVVNGVELLRTNSAVIRPSGADGVPWESGLFGLLQEASRLVGGRRFDIVHGQCQAGALLGAMFYREAGAALVISAHETEPESDSFGAARSRLVFGHLPYSAAVVGSEYFRAQALRHGAPPDKVHLVYSGVDTKAFSPAVDGSCIRAEIGVGPDTCLVLLVGRFKKRKGIVELIQALRSVRDANADVHGLIVGSCNSASIDYRDRMHHTVAACGLQDNVTIAEERWDFDRMPNVFAAADIVVQPSHREGLGIAVLEAMAAGKPVIGAAVEGIREIIVDGGTGVLVPPEDPNALAAAILDLIGDPARGRSLSDRALRDVRARMSQSRLVAGTEAVYARVLGTASR
jgi:glycosyltransferase involved in cell wall biosynthesis